jgi:acetylglutamate kinase
MTTPDQQSKIFQKISFLSETLPNIKKHIGERFVIYYDGVALYDKQLAMQFASDIVLMKELGISVVIVHGGEKTVDEMHAKFNLKCTYVDGVRITDSESIKVVEMATHYVNKCIVTNIHEAGGSAIGISGKDGNLIEAKRHRSAKNNPNSNIKNIVDLGFTGEPTTINPDLLITLEDTPFIPIVAPIAHGDSGTTFQMNPMLIAAVIASAIMAEKFIVVSDNEAAITALGGKGTHINQKLATLRINNVEGEQKDRLTRYINLAMSVLQNKTDSISIIDGSIPHALALDVFTSEKCGASITAS